MNIEQEAALNRLIHTAQRNTGQGRKVAGFLLAWWNAETCGGFDPTDLWAVDTAISRDIVTIVLMVASLHTYPDCLGYGEAFEGLVRQWRPHLFSRDLNE